MPLSPHSAGGQDLCQAGVILGGRCSRQEPSVLCRCFREQDDAQGSLELSPVQHGATGDSVGRAVFLDAFSLTDPLP